MDTGQHASLDAVAGVSRLDDPVRRRLYAYVAAADGSVSRDEAAAAVGLGRSVTAYHLDRLAEVGLVTTSYARPPGRGGPGAGRPAKRYTRSQRAVAVSVPPRSYRLLSRLLTEAVAGAESQALRAAVETAARQAGRVAAAGTDVERALRACGYEPARGAGGGIELRNCPFHPLAHEHAVLVCGLNLQLVHGLLEAAGDPAARAELAPRPGRCCAAILGPARHRASVPRGDGTRPPSQDRDTAQGDACPE